VTCGGAARSDSVTIATAPFSIALAANRAPSAREPATAKKSDPGPARRESDASWSIATDGSPLIERTAGGSIAAINSESGNVRERPGRTAETDSDIAQVMVFTLVSSGTAGTGVPRPSPRHR